VADALLELAVLFALCVGAGVLFQRFKMPPIVGFLAIGALVGPHAIGLVRQREMVDELAQVGVVVLLFALGMEVPLSQLARLRRQILLGGGLQIGATVLAVALACWLGGSTPGESVFLGFLLSLSSTAAVTKVLVDHGEFAAPHGRLAIAIAIAQDLAIVPMILVVPMLRGAGGGGPGIVQSFENLALLIAVLAAARLLVPRVLALVSRTRSRELFVLTLATICLLLAVCTDRLGLSMALGAFVAGVLIADTDFHGHAVAEVEPFRDALASLFFVSIGMLFDPLTLVDAPWLVLLALLAAVAGKAAIVAVAARTLGQPGWVRLRAGLLLAQVGEFSFVLAQLVRNTELLPARAERIFMTVAVLSIASTPLLHGVGRWLVMRSRQRDGAQVRGGDPGLSAHAIVVGFGPTGRGVLEALRALGLPAVAVESNAQTVRAERARGTPIEHGDATRTAVLKSLGIERARILVLAINDTAAAARIAKIARQLAPQVHVLARSVYNGEVGELRAAGAHEVVPQELEATVEILVRVLRRFLVPDDEIGRHVARARGAADGSDKAAAVGRLPPAQIGDYMPGLGVGVHRIADGSQAAGRTIAQLGLRKSTGCSLIAVRRGQANLTALELDTQLLVEDVVVVIGPTERLADAAAAFHAPAAASDAARPARAEAQP
jgi:CPA2 family monovalent cation:H+ antiporter-2